MSNLFARLARRLRSRSRDSLPVWHDARYRLAIGSIESQSGIEPRRADLVAAYLLDRGLVARHGLRQPEPVSYEAARRVHADRWLEALLDPAVLARIFAVETRDVHVEDT